MTTDATEQILSMDTPTLSDALDQLGAPGVVNGLAPLTTLTRLAGRAVTIALEAVTDPGATSARHLGTAAVDASSAGDVIVVANAGRTDVAGWGGILSQAAALRGVSGVVVDGASRDVDEAETAQLALFARAATPVTARGRVRERAWDVPVEISGVAVQPGDLIVADRSGMVVVANAIAARVAELGQRIAQRESAMVERLRSGEPVSAVMSHEYETALRRVSIEKGNVDGHN